jgi:hypothetical protein
MHAIAKFSRYLGNYVMPNAGKDQANKALRRSLNSWKNKVLKDGHHKNTQAKLADQEVTPSRRYDLSSDFLQKSPSHPE